MTCCRWPAVCKGRYFVRNLGRKSILGSFDEVIQFCREPGAGPFFFAARDRLVSGPKRLTRLEILESSLEFGLQSGPPAEDKSLLTKNLSPVKSKPNPTRAHKIHPQHTSEDGPKKGFRATHLSEQPSRQIFLSSAFQHLVHASPSRAIFSLFRVGFYAYKLFIVLLTFFGLEEGHNTILRAMR